MRKDYCASSPITMIMTFARLQDAGTEIISLTATDDLVGVIDPDMSDQAASAQLRQEQFAAGATIGVDQLHWLGLPDAGPYDYFNMRRSIIQFIRRFRPDFLMTCDPWLPYEAHQDHIQTGLAFAEASYLHGLVRLKTDPEIDSSYRPYTISGVAFYSTHATNTVIDISSFRSRKHEAAGCYQAQFTPEEMARLQVDLEAEELACAKDSPFTHGEAFKILRPDQLHLNVHTWRS